jgi:hypothetical protein
VAAEPSPAVAQEQAFSGGRLLTKYLQFINIYTRSRVRVARLHLAIVGSSSPVIFPNRLGSHDRNVDTLRALAIASGLKMLISY